MNTDNEGTGSGTDFATARGRDWPSVRQFNIFLANRIGGLMDVVRRFESSEISIVSLTIVDSSDCAIIRMVFSDPERAQEILDLAQLAYTESDLVVVKLPDTRQPIAQICKTLLGAELNVHYAYPLLVTVGYEGGNALAIHVDDLDLAVHTLQDKGFTLYNEDDLK